MESKRDYIFYLNWEDTIKNIRKVGYLANIENEFYLLISGEKNAQTAYANGFIGIPGFRSGEIYKSSELFLFFKNRILNKEIENPCEELLKNEGKSMIDSFSLEEVPEGIAEKKKEALLEAYKIQEEKKKVQAKNTEEAYLL